MSVSAQGPLPSAAPPAAEAPSVAATAPTSAAPVDTDGVPLPQRLIAVSAILGAIAMVSLDGAIANVALPSISQELHATPAEAVWVVTAYQLAVVMFLLPAAALGERMGYRRVFVGGLVLFTLASALCAFAPSMSWLVAARYLQGLGSAAVMPLGLALLRFTYPKRLLGHAIGWNAMAVAAAAAAGPSLGAFILAVAGWPWLFAVNIPVGLLVLAASTKLPAPRGTHQKMDRVSVVLNACAFAAFVLGSDWLLSHSLVGGSLIAFAVVCMTLLVRREMPRAAPLIPLDLLRSHSFRISIIASVCCFTGQMASYVALPFFIQHNLGQSALATGLLMTPWPLCVMLAATLSGRLSDRFPTAWLCAVGGSCMAAGLILCTTLTFVHGDPRWLLAVFTGLAGLGFGLFQTPNNRNMLMAAPKERSGAAGGAQGMARLTGQTLGSLMMGLLFTLLPSQGATHWGLVASAVLTFTAGMVSLLRSPGRTA